VCLVVHIETVLADETFATNLTGIGLEKWKIAVILRNLPFYIVKNQP
jgi:hypothetical protein